MHLAQTYKANGGPQGTYLIDISKGSAWVMGFPRGVTPRVGCGVGNGGDLPATDVFRSLTCRSIACASTNCGSKPETAVQVVSESLEVQTQRRSKKSPQHPSPTKVRGENNKQVLDTAAEGVANNFGTLRHGLAVEHGVKQKLQQRSNVPKRRKHKAYETETNFVNVECSQAPNCGGVS